MRRALFLVLVAGCATGGGGGGGGGTAAPPAPKAVRQSLVETIHGEKVADPFRGLEIGTDPAVQAWTDGQNGITRRTLDGRSSRAALRARLESLASIGRVMQPRVFGGRVFYQKRTGIENQPALCVRDGFSGSSRRVVDPNSLSAEGLVALDWWQPSQDGSRIAYGMSERGTELSTLRIKEVETGKILSDEIPRTRAASIAWLPDQSGFYYTQYPAPGTVPKDEETYHRRVHFHQIGTSLEEDRLIFGDNREKEDWPELSLSRDGRWLVVTVLMNTWTKCEIFAKDLKEGGRWVPVVKGIDAKFFPVIHNDTLYVLTNWKAPKFRIMSCAPTETDPEQWKEIVPEGEATISSFEIVGGRLAILELRDATSRLRTVALDGSGGADIELPGLGTVGEIQADPDGNSLVFDYLSFFSPPSLFKVDVTTGILKEFERVEGIDTTPYESSQVRYTSKDGTSIPMFLVHKKGIARNGNHPTLLTGYGGFGLSRTPYFSSAIMMWLEKGGVFAMPNLRGGGEYGEAWHKAGMLATKQNTFDDFIAAAEWLVKEQVTSPAKLAILGGSNGGLLVGAALTQRPDLFRAVVCDVPLLDMVRFHKFQLARLWIKEYGDPDKAEDFKWLYAYSPYHRVKDGTPYPAVLLRTAEGDTRVDPMHARKMCARLLEASTSKRPILFWCDKNAGHGAGKPLSKQLDDLADAYAFLTWQLGME
ncbi:MAG TPA: prolyl oligopeptidase family serine peptidase [Planctomycetota bacterium]|nr:prolyl oligopeptidase family serine peptidase [Planctomycetota bacterium]